MGFIEEIVERVQVKVFLFELSLISHIDSWTRVLGLEILHFDLVVEFLILPNSLDVEPIFLLLIVLPLVLLSLNFDESFVEVLSGHKAIDFILSEVVLEKFVVNCGAH